MSNHLDTRPAAGRIITAPAPPPARRSRRSSPLGQLLPGLVLCLGAAAAALAVNRLVPAMSPLLTAIVLGAILANLRSLPGRLRPGLTFSAKTILRLGIALLGLQLLIGDILGLGWEIIVVVVAIVALGILGTMYAGSLLGLPWSQRILIACGFSICGAAAVAAVDDVTGADEEEVLTAVALVVLFGTLMIPMVPLLSGWAGLSDLEAGLWAGGSIHEVAQVVAVGETLGGAALGVAVVVKLARVLMLAPVVAALGIRRRILAGADSAAERPPLVPVFVLGFLACVGIRSTGVVPPAVLDAVGVLRTVLLTAAMFALGTGIRIATLHKVGARPFLLAAVSTILVAGIALAGIMVVTAVSA